MNVAEQIRETLLDPNRSHRIDLSSVDPELLFFKESELIEDYIEGSLSEAESSLFKKNFLVTDERQELLNEIRLLKRFSSDSWKFNAESVELGKGRGPSRILMLGLALIILAALVFLAVRFF